MASGLNAGPVVVEDMSFKDAQKGHRATIDGTKYLVQIRQLNPITLVPGGKVTVSVEYTALAISRDGGAPFVNSEADRQEAVRAVRAYCEAKEIALGPNIPVEVSFNPAHAGDNAELVISGICDLKLWLG